MEEDSLGRRGVCFDDFDGFVEGFSGVDDYGQVKVGGDFEVTGEYLPLGIGGREVVVEVEACFADGEDFWVVCEPGQFFEGFAGDEPGFVRVDADCGVEVVEFPGKGEGFAVVFGVCTDGDPCGDPGGDASLDDGVDVFEVGFEGQVTVGVD